MQVLNVKGHLTFLDQFIVKLVPSCQAGKLGTWEMGNGMEKETINGDGEAVGYCRRRGK